MAYLVIFFGILTAVLGVWGFGPWSPPWAATDWMFWFCLAVFLFLLFLTSFMRWRGYRRRPLT
jgi:hypothetical protein